MGWVTTNWYKGTTILEFFENMINTENNRVKETVLDAALVRRQHAYAAVERYNKQTQEREVYCAVAIVGWTRSAYYNFSYKMMSEHAGPYCVDCPIRILNLLTPLKPDGTNAYKYASEWRERVKEYHKNRPTKYNRHAKSYHRMEGLKGYKVELIAEDYKWAILKEIEKNKDLYVAEEFKKRKTNKNKYPTGAIYKLKQGIAIVSQYAGIKNYGKQIVKYPKFYSLTKEGERLVKRHLLKGLINEN